jgi:hypothetical protein
MSVHRFVTLVDIDERTALWHCSKTAFDPMPTPITDAKGDGSSCNLYPPAAVASFDLVLVARLATGD